MARHTSFRYCLDPTVEQQAVLARHAGAARFAFNQCLRLHLQARAAHRQDDSVAVPWSGFDLVNLFNAWKKTEQAGRRLVVDGSGIAEVEVTGLRWRSSVCQQVFEEAAIDLGKALSAWTESRAGRRSGRRVGHPRVKKKHSDVSSFRLRNKHPKGGRSAIRVGDTHPRSVTLPGIGTVRVHDDTRAAAAPGRQRSGESAVRHRLPSRGPLGSGTPKQEARSPTPADRNALAVTLVAAKRIWKTREQTFSQHLLPESTTPEKGGADQLRQSCSACFTDRIHLHVRDVVRSCDRRAPGQ